MTLGEYLRDLNKLVEVYPEALNFNIVYSVDDEGNEYKEVISTPTIGESIVQYGDIMVMGYLKGQGGELKLKDCNTVVIN